MRARSSGGRAASTFDWAATSTALEPELGGGAVGTPARPSAVASGPVRPVRRAS